MQEGQKRKTSSLSILAIAGVEPYHEKAGEEYMKGFNPSNGENA